jgi:hypothetical protein
MGERVYPYGRPADSWGGAPNRFAYFVQRVGLRWQVWCEYEDGHSDPNGADRWRAVYGVTFWRCITALRIAADMTHAHQQGGWMEFESTAGEPQEDERFCTCHPDERPHPCPRRYALTECLASVPTQSPTDPASPLSRGEEGR